MKKLIILSAITISGLIYTSANAQDRYRNNIRSGHENYRDQRSDNRMHNDYVQPRFQSDHRENAYRNDEHFQNGYRETRYKDEQHFSQDNRRDENSNYRMRK
jgi:hypothetical protein